MSNHYRSEILFIFGLLGLKYFYALALFAGLANIVPFAGAAISGTLAGLVALIDSPAKMLGVGLFYVVYYQIESAILTPHIMKSTVDLPPLAIIIALAIGAGLAGILAPPGGGADRGHHRRPAGRVCRNRPGRRLPHRLIAH